MLIDQQDLHVSRAMSAGHTGKLVTTPMIVRNFTPFPVLTTERLTLRQLRRSDDLEVFALRSDREINRYLDRPACKTIDDARIFIDRIMENSNKNDSLYWAIALRGSDKLIGTICLFDFSGEKCEIGYELMTGYQGQGIMREASQKVIDYAFHAIGIQTIEALFHRDNQRSVNLLEKLSFISPDEPDRTNPELVRFYLTHS